MASIFIEKFQSLPALGKFRKEREQLESAVIVKQDLTDPKGVHFATRPANEAKGNVARINVSLKLVYFALSH